ncbi:MAG: Stk1 family PASTA domain-containing Ser/Thr kinase [Eubacteriales bacterium]|nr:Stk1 family PASTA domain-containing Ser/Thr kinase [Eubacteriales bacterium]
MLKTGMIIAERYEILGKIGTGGMADVYKAKDHKLNRYVAVKVLKPEFREDTTFIRKFRSEAQAAAGLTHPNIVNVFDVGDDEGVYYIVMELIEGITLKEYITKKGRLSIKEATSIAIQVSMGLEAAHSHGIVHRDVKPQNIIISTDGKVKVTDFGIARAASSNTISSNVMGSVHYSSPEQVRGGYSDEKSDIYSLGITLYEMVTGKVPFDGDTTVAIAIKHLQEEMVPPSVFAPELPYSLEQIIFKCTQKSVDRRYVRMEEVIADLKHSLIDPQGDFVKHSSLDNDAKTVVISDEELGEIKHSPKQPAKPKVEDLEEEVYDTDYDDSDDDESYKRRKQKQTKNKRRKKNRSAGRALTIAALVAGAILLIVLIIFIGRASGLIGGSSEPDTEQNQPQDEQNTEDDSMVVVPNIVGKTEEEARTITNEMHIGIQPMGEEASVQEKGRISSQDIPEGTKVQAYSTLKYYVSKGAQEVTIPELDGRTGVEAQQMLEDMGLNVTVQKEYSELDEEGYPIVDPGYVYYTTPESGTTAKSGDTVTLVVSRGVYYEDSAEVPSVVGMTKNDALTTLGKFIDINIVEERNPDVAVDEVISQDPEAYSYADPDLPITITVSTGNQEPGAAGNTEEAENAQNTQAQNTDTNAAAAAGEIWKCTQRLNTPTGYQGGLVRLELVQDVNGQPTATRVVDGQQLQFPYQLDITGAPGVSEGTLYLSEQRDGQYEELGHYPVQFEKAE